MNLESMDGTERTEVLRAFLLGTLAGKDVERVEYSVLSDEGLYELLLATEEELIDEYIRGTLSPGEASSFRGYLDRLPGGRTRIDFARELQESLEVSGTPTPIWRSRWLALSRGLSDFLRGQTPTWAFALVLACLGFAIYGSIPFQESPLVLTSGVTRGEGDVPTVSLAASGDYLPVMLDLGVQSHERYRATLYDADSREIFLSGGLSANVTERHIQVAFVIPLGGLEPGDYSISLEGESPSMANESLGRYTFRLLE